MVEQHLTTESLRAFVTSNSVDAEFVALHMRATSVEETANGLGVAPDRIVKSVVLLVDGSPVVAIANGTTALNTKLLAGHLQVSRKKIKLADPSRVREITGYAVGGVPPFGHKSRLRTLVGCGVLSQPEVFAGGGEPETVVRVRPDEILRVTGAETVSL
jgi:Cys-tRNA(Pro) deacylase